MLPLHKPSNVLFLWSGLFIDGPEECPGFCVLLCGWWRICLYLFNFFFFSFPLCFTTSPQMEKALFTACALTDRPYQQPVGGMQDPPERVYQWLLTFRAWVVPGAEVLRLPHRWQLVSQGLLVLGKAPTVPTPAFLSGSGSCHLEC